MHHLGIPGSQARNEERPAGGSFFSVAGCLLQFMSYTEHPAWHCMRDLLMVTVPPHPVRYDPHKCRMKHFVTFSFGPDRIIGHYRAEFAVMVTK